MKRIYSISSIIFRSGVYNSNKTNKYILIAPVSFRIESVTKYIEI